MYTRRRVRRAVGELGKIGRNARNPCWSESGQIACCCMMMRFGALVAS